MKFRELYISSVSACFELENNAPYYADEAFDVQLNGALALAGVRTNVFSLFDLKPATEYSVTVGEDTVNFTTRNESACISVKDFGAAGDGIADDTSALQGAISCCPKNGRVTVPAGVYNIRPLTLKSHITLELCEGALLLGDTVEEHYPTIPGEIKDANNESDVLISLWEGTPVTNRQSLISCHYGEDIAIVGRGTIDGNAQNSTWWKNVKEREIGRPRLVFLNKCSDFVMHGVCCKNSASWHLHPIFSHDLAFYDIAVEAPKNSPNTDGTDPECCDRVSYIGVRFSVGDDAIAIKSGKMYIGMKYQTPATRHLIRNCLMEYAHGAVVLGSEMSGGIKELSVSQCLFSHTDRGLRIKTRRGRGKYAVIDGVEFSNIKMENVMTPLVMNMYYFCDVDGKTEYVWSKKPQPVDDRTPYLGEFTFRDIVCDDCEWAAGYFYGLPEQPIGSVTIENVKFSMKENASEGFPAMMSYIDKSCRQGLYFNCVKRVHLKNVTVTNHVGEAVVTENVGEVTEE